ncbi:hypothetical protein [Lactobacillus psittaci]|uniref:Uncharacterized protein n=1 Tax=Lactobacillus psittaci DSM 15354 TaxID=1122152 RepID=A0A0R1SA24_9LACO|nr:hypothetical protein [Lactobacillus psittaci]KRL63253.1 hypothetical protein FC23_GL000822 [Lactobacillus psittaci DSM 15354]
MDTIKIIKLADELATNQSQYLQNTDKIDAEAIYKVINSLEVLTKPIKAYFGMSQDEYYATESDHKLTLLDMNDKLDQLHDRILTNHVDGYVDQAEINLTYNHENPYEDGMYDAETDYHVLTYSLKVIAATLAVAPTELKKVISKDAVLSVGLATYALTNQ